MSSDAVAWLLNGDPAVRWQTERDLLDRPPATWRTTRRRIATEGWGARLLAAQDPAGTWAGGLYSPKWTSTTYTLLLLRRLGLDQANLQAIAGCRRLLDGARWIDEGVSYGKTHAYAERCVNGMVLSLASWFDVDDTRIDGLAALLLDAQMEDGGWNCRDHEGATHGSFHTTISVLEGLIIWQRRGNTGVAAAAIGDGHEFMLRHRMFRSHRSGSVIDGAWLTPAFPPRWHYDVMRGLDHLRDAGANRDDRAAEAIKLVRSQQRADGRWAKGRTYSGKQWFTMEHGRNPSRWNTLRARRILRWWDGGR